MTQKNTQDDYDTQNYTLLLVRWQSAARECEEVHSFMVNFPTVQSL